MTVGQSPDARTRQALTARLRQALPGQTFLEADYRRYFDSWSVDSNALSLGLSHHFGDTRRRRRVATAGTTRRALSSTRPPTRGRPSTSRQTSGSFPFNSDTYTGRVEITPKSGLFQMPPGTSLKLQYERYLATTGFQAGVFTGGFQIPLK